MRQTSYLLSGALLLGLILIVVGIIALFTRQRQIEKTRFKAGGIEVVTTSVGVIIFAGGLSLVAISGSIADATGVAIIGGNITGSESGIPASSPTWQDLVLSNQDMWISIGIYVGLAALLLQVIVVLWRAWRMRRRATSRAIAES
jgi:hypothetical protein